jgi:preprotein translocase SecF subunit
VVFDRIRENMGMAKRRGDVAEVANTSIVQTLVRSINTSFTTMLAIGAVLLLGGATLKPLATALLVGIISGTYSSIFVASAVWVDWKKRAEMRA